MAERRKRESETPIPKKIRPMLAELVDESPSHRQQWLCEFKWDGIRAIVYIKSPYEVMITSEDGQEITDQIQI